MANPLNISKNFNRIRAMRGMTLENIAHETKYSMHTIHNIAQDRVTPTVETLCKLAEVLAVPVQEFFKD